MELWRLIELLHKWRDEHGPKTPVFVEITDEDYNTVRLPVTNVTAWTDPHTVIQTAIMVNTPTVESIDVTR